MRSRRNPVLLGLLALILIGTALLWARDSAQGEGAVAEEWVARYDGPGSAVDVAYALAVDGAGSVYVTGESYDSGTNSDYATIKYGPDGSEQWVARYDGPGSFVDLPHALVVDGAGSVYVTGQSSLSNRAGTDDYTTIKYGPDGSEQWVARYDGPAGAIDRPYALAVDGTGDVFVAGGSYGLGTGLDYATVKYGPDGSEQWVARYDGPAISVDVGHALAVDGAGNVYVTGKSLSSDTGFDFTTIKYGPDGSEQWVARYDGPAGGDDISFALAVDAEANVYVTGSSTGAGTGMDFATIKYGPDGSEQWVARYDGPANNFDISIAAVVDGGGNVYVAGSSTGSGTHWDYATIKYGPDGSEQWVARYDGPASDTDSPTSLAVSTEGDVYVTGKSPGSGTGVDYATIKYGPDGSQQWIARYDGPASGGDSAASLAVDAAGNVYVTGGSPGSGTAFDYATIKYAPALKPTPTPSQTPCPPEGCSTPAGDANCDTSVNSIDAALVLQLNAGLLGSLACPDSADVNQDGQVNSIDAALILQYVAGLIDSLPP